MLTFCIISIAIILCIIAYMMRRKHHEDTELFSDEESATASTKDEKIDNAIEYVNAYSKELWEKLQDALLFNNHYFTYSEMESFGEESKALYERLDFLRIKGKLGDVNNVDQAKELYESIKGIENIRKNHNEQFCKRELEENKEFFDTVLPYPLDNQQRESIVKLEDNCLVISSAGSGKTSTMIGKLLYLVQKRGIKPFRILTITYTHKAAEELTQRLKGTGLSCMTFHKLAMNIVTEVEKKKPSIVEPQVFLSAFYSQLAKPEFREAVLNYLTDYKSLMKNEHDYVSSVDYYADRKKYGVISIYPDKDGRMITTKSEEERKICSYLTELGVKYKYEQAYEIETYTEEYRQYKPDFTVYYTDSEGVERKLYLEHFGINFSGMVPKWFGNNCVGGWNEANERYHEGIEWKKNTHKQNGTKLIYTTSADFHNGSIRNVLRTKLEQAGVPINEPTKEELIDMVMSRSKNLENALLQLIQGFVNLVKANGKNIDDIIEEAEKRHSSRDVFVIEKIVRPVWNEYQGILSKKQEMDFTDVIVKATQYCNEGKWPQKYDFILIDEFQDISVDRYNFLQSLRTDRPKTKLYCVGDDWQSIYRFTGSDMSLFAEFSKYFGYTEECKIETTYRFGMPLIKESSRFVEKNPLQKKKNIHPRKVKEGDLQPETKISYMAYKDKAHLINLLDRMIARVPADKSAYIISRYSYDVRDIIGNHKVHHNANDDSVSIEFGNRKVKFMTIHGSKGLEADYVFMINCNSGLYGFPSLVSDDPIMDYVLSDPEHYEYAEERRVFYVGITRAKTHTVVLYNEDTPSPFVYEMDENVIQNPNPCPWCGEGRRIVRYEGWTVNKTKYIAWGCDNKAANCQYFEREFFNGKEEISRSRRYIPSKARPRQ